MDGVPRASLEDTGPVDTTASFYMLISMQNRLIYSSSGLDATTTSNSGPVSRPASNDVGSEQGVLPTSVKSNGFLL